MDLNPARDVGTCGAFGAGAPRQRQRAPNPSTTTALEQRPYLRRKAAHHADRNPFFHKGGKPQTQRGHRWFPPHPLTHRQSFEPAAFPFSTTDCGIRCERSLHMRRTTGHLLAPVQAQLSPRTPICAGAVVFADGIEPAKQPPIASKNNPTPSHEQRRWRGWHAENPLIDLRNRRVSTNPDTQGPAEESNRAEKAGAPV